MPKTIRNKYDEKLTYENLMNAHIKSRKNKSTKKDIILFNLKQEEYIKYLYEVFKNCGIKASYKKLSTTHLCTILSIYFDFCIFLSFGSYT